MPMPPRMPDHEGIQMVETLRQRRGYTDDWEINEELDNDILSRLRMEKAELNRRLETTKPEKLDAKDISLLRKYEVGVAYLEIRNTPDSRSSLEKIAAIVGGKTPTGQPTDSARYEARRQHALTPGQDSRVQVRHDHFTA